MMNQLVSFNPFRCRMWEHHDRLEDGITEDSCKAEIASFIAHGQQVSVLGRPLRNDPTHDVELIYGARRLFVARQLNMPLKVKLRSLTDREAIIAMDIENRQRQDVSAYERGVSYARLLQGNLFTSQDEIAKALKVSSSQISRLLKIAKLPQAVVDAFQDPCMLRECWGLDLYHACQDPARRTHIEGVARAISRFPERPPAAKIFKELILGHASPARRSRNGTNEPVRDRAGKTIFHVRRKKDTVELIIPIRNASNSPMHELKHVVAQALQDATPQVID